MKIVKRLLLILLLIPCIAWLAINGILWFGSGSISKFATKKLGTEVSFKRASLHLFPTPGVALHKLKIGGDSPTLEAESVSGSLYLRPIFSGDIMPSNLHVTGLKMKEPVLNADTLQADLEPLDLGEKDVKKGKGSILLKGLTVVDGVDHYQTDSLSGDLNLTLKKDSPSFLADLHVQGFGYSDGETVITRVNADLKDIKGSVTEVGDATVTVNLDARSIDLVNPAIHITSVKQVSSPVVVKVPAAGGYEVSGPVTIDDAIFTTANREFSRVSSTIGMLITSPLKDFKAEKIGFSVANMPGTIKTQFSMTKTQYIVGDTTLDLKLGKVTAATTIDRKGEKKIAGHLKATDVHVTDILKALTPESAESYGGVLHAFSTKFSASSGHLKDTLSATGDFAIDDIEVKGKKLREEILKAAEKTPILALPETSPEEKKQHLIEGDFKVKDQVVSVSEVRTPFKHFTLEANGGVNLNKEVDMEVEVVFLEETFATLGLGIEPLKKLFGNIGKHTIPLVVRGTLPDISVSSDGLEWLERVVGISLVEDIGVGVIEAGEAMKGPEKPQAG